MESARTPIWFSAFVAGCGGLLAQVLVVREMLVVFHGNELSIGVILGMWLLWTGLGSLALGSAAARARRQRRLLALLLALGAVAIPCTVAAASGLKPFLLRSGASLGQVLPFRTLLISAFVLLGPLCLINGLLFPTACRAADLPGGTGRVYLLEAVGAATGVALHCFVLVQTVSPLAVSLAAGVVWCGAALWLAGRGSRFVGGAAAVVAGACLAALAYRTPARLRQYVEQASWPGVVHVDTRDSRYGRVTVVRPEGTAEQASLYHNSALQVTYPDPPEAQAIAHVPMLAHPAPRRVLLLGGAVGVAEEALKHPTVESVTCVELDPAAVEAVREHFPPGAVRALSDPRVRLVLGDARAFLKGAAERHDVVICVAEPPATAQANRLYTREFFCEVAQVLAEGGVFAFRGDGGHTYIADENRRMLSCLHRTLGGVFPAVVVLPGARCTFLASNGEGVLTDDLHTLYERMLGRGVEAVHVEPLFVDASSESLRDELDRALAEPSSENRDLAPRCYIFAAQRWGRSQGTRESRFDLGRLLTWLDARRAVAPLVLLGLIVLASAVVPLCRGRVGDAALGLAVCATGFIEMAVEFAVLLGFQVVCGYVYHYVGILVSAFMLGLAVGAWRAGRARPSWRRMRWVQVAICGYPLVLLGFLFAAQGLALPAGLWAVVFTGVALLAGLVGGLQFPLAVALHSRGQASAGSLYGLDLFGSCLGALAVSSVIVPTVGLPVLCGMLAALGGVALAALAGRAPRPSR